MGSIELPKKIPNLIPMQKFRLLLVFSGLLLSAMVLGQKPREFSPAPEKFPEELQTYFKGSLSDEQKHFVDQFLITWTTDTLFEENQKLTVIGHLNGMLRQNARLNHLMKYLQMIQMFRTDPSRQVYFEGWKSQLETLLAEKKLPASRLTYFLENTDGLIKRGELFSSTALIWKADSTLLDFVPGSFHIRLGTTRLVCLSVRDSIVIENTRGIYNPVEQKWYGDGGLVTWERAGYPRDSVYAELGTYTLDLTKPGYRTDSAKLVHKQFFHSPLPGVLTDQVKKNTSPEMATYPVFDSYEKTFVIRSIFPGFDFSGGLSMRGARLVGSGNNVQEATLKVSRNDTLFMVVRSNYIAFRKEQIISRNAAVLVIINRDSLYHGNMNFSYLHPNREISVTRSDDIGSQSPWFNSYHQLDMLFDQMYYKLGAKEILFTMNRGASIGNASFQSVNFFNGRQYDALQGVDPIHPLVAVRNFVRYFQSSEFPINDLASYLRLSPEQTQKMMFRLASMGFLYYNPEDGMVKVKPKLNNFIQASLGKIDYDVIDLRSRTEAPLENARLNLQTFDLTINGIPSIALSDSQNVFISPYQGSIIMKKNRSFQFSGRIDAGLFTFYGSNFFFDYEQFKINLQKVDSLSIRVQTDERDNFGFAKLAGVKNIVQNLTGDLLIDDPSNKSGVKGLKQYPVFQSRENSYVYFDNPDIQKGVYARDKFYFQVSPFVIDSLDRFSKNDMRFRGKFVSAGIFPEMEQTLVLQPDYSLGFDIIAPAEGLPIYLGKGRFYRQANLSNKGLTGNGSFDYLTSTTESEALFFYPDSLNAKAKRFSIRKQPDGGSFPETAGNDLTVHWEPYHDQLLAYQGKTPFTMYGQQATLAGNLKLAPSGLSGNGTVDLISAVLVSDRYAFRSDRFLADTASFSLRSAKPSVYTLLAQNLRTEIDFAKRQGTFSSNSDYTLTTLPENQYISYIDQMVWYMDQQKIDLLSAKPFNAKQVPAPYKNVIDSVDFTLTGARYISVRKDQDSLSFISPKATYDYNSNVLNATGVRFVRVADALVYPAHEFLSVAEKADMLPMDSSVIIADAKTKFHRIHTAKVKIASRYKYSGNGWYDYVDENKSVQRIHLTEISVDDSIQTIARGEIAETDQFTLSPNYAYQGRVMLNARDRLLNFKGAVMLNYACEPLSRRWLAFETRINPDSILIPVSAQPMDVNRNNLYAGMMMDNDSVHVYSAFFQPRKNYKDGYISTSEGYLYFAKDSSTYLVGSLSRMKDPSSPGNLIALNRNTCRFHGEGKINLNIDLGQMQLQAAGKVFHNLAANMPYLNLTLIVDFPFLDKALQLAATDFDSLPGKGNISLGDRAIRKNITELIGEEKTKKFYDEIVLYGQVRSLPVELAKTMVLGDVHLLWNNKSNSYQSYGLIGVRNINGREINKYVEGYVELYRKRTGDICDIFLKADDNTWYYFGYTREVMQAISSNRDFNNLLRVLKPEQRQVKPPRKGMPGYIYMVASDTKISQFLRHYEDVLEERKAGTPSE